MPDPTLLLCDGCGQLASPSHIARRLKRLEFATRFRPVHVQTLLLSGIAPEDDREFLYFPEGPLRGEGQRMLEAVGIRSEEKSREAVLAEFQKRGLLLAHLLECPLEHGVPVPPPVQLLESRLSWTIARIRRAIHPMRVFLISPELGPVADRLRQADLGCPVLPPVTGAYLSTAGGEEAEIQTLRRALAAVEAQAGAHHCDEGHCER